MITEWMLSTLLDYAKDGVIAGIKQKDFDSILNKTFREFEGKCFGFSSSDFKKFTESPEVRTHFEHHLTDRELDFEYLGKILRRYVNLEGDVSPKAFLQEFYDKFEMNLVKNPQLKAQLDLRYQKSAQDMLQNIQHSTDELKHDQERTLELLECLVQQGIQKGDRKLCLRGYDLSEFQILKIAENALRNAESSYEKGCSFQVFHLIAIFIYRF